MNFFEHQELAQKQTRRLVWMFTVSVLVVILVSWLALGSIVWLAVGWMAMKADNPPPGWWQVMSNGWVLLATLGGTIVVILFGSIGKMFELRDGGRVVAEMLGGRRVEPATTDPHERKLMNVVEEMSIASGTPVPPVYLLDDETGINAFAAGFEATDAVIGVTRGCIEKLSRDELQGVIAHEFSHVIHGDMRLNLRMIGWIYGIFALAAIGEGLMRVVWYSGGSSRRSNRDGGGAIVFAVLAAGLVLLIIGYVGMALGKMIQASVSRQREYLADASAVQYTRYPEGIAGALKKIGGYGKMGSDLGVTGAGQFNHMFFGRNRDHLDPFDGLYASHPPLTNRISRLDPAFDGTFPEIVPEESEAQAAQEADDRPAVDRLGDLLGAEGMVGAMAGAAVVA
ncbi:MAG: M48 family metallopeptidase, partial [Phycisphaeraceae bacterium]|nr:M48 family metallopeptidase [Phycisphaeraceae bacterium]